MLPLLTVLLAFMSAAVARPDATFERRATPTVYLAGDSTMAELKGANGIEGWGHYLQYSLSVPVVNNAISGRSARSFTAEGRFDGIASNVKSGDFVIIEFGHNDGGSLSPTDNGRSDCPGAGNETCTSTYNGQTVTVHTFPWYFIQAAKLFTSKGAKVIFSSQTPNNPWESGSFSYSGGRFITYAHDSAITAGAAYIDHGAYTANIFKTLGLNTVKGYFPNDHTHTSPVGADVVAKAFVKGLACAGTGTSELASYVKNTTSGIQGTCI
ncbi:SGNH hydrolase [Crepidotus variabilis]|uniref:SGNH hydrolase n=1 Tax=Crepidotus variabilis TaxID=179855 RepID=A0A9P6EL53_9AGAR|nr:SGNH hydrolase [Crepidotus variabilis]